MTARALAAEFFGSFAWVSALCGAYLFAVPAGAGMAAPAVAVGLAVLMMSGSVGHLSGGHFNPAVTVGLIAAGRFESTNAIGYILAQVAGAIAAVFLFQFILAGAVSAGPSPTGRWNDFAAISNTYGGPRGFSMAASFVTEVVITTILMIVVVGTRAGNAPAGFAPLAIAAAYIALHLVAIPVTNASLNPARSTATAVLAGGQAMSQLWLFWIAPILGGIVGGSIGGWLQDE